jgi:murein DD-endopeptidase MepM/ murein hydrolase activator NlpD
VTAGLAADGVVGTHTCAVVRCRQLGARELRRGSRGWDVAELQFLLAWHGFPSGGFDGRFGAHVEGALRRFQRWAGLTQDGVAGAGTITALSQGPPPIPIALAPPVAAPASDGFGPRGDRFHAGIDFPVPLGTPVHAAAAGRVTWVGYREGWGLLVTLAHGQGVRTLYAHLSTAAVVVGQAVPAGMVVGAAGATGDATGSHVHFEVRLRGAAVDPAPALLARGLAGN